MRRFGCPSCGAPLQAGGSKCSSCGKSVDAGRLDWAVRGAVVGRVETVPPALTGTVSCPMSDNGIAGQRTQGVTVDYHVPLDASPGSYTGTVTLSAGDDRAELALAVKAPTSVR